MTTSQLLFRTYVKSNFKSKIVSGSLWNPLLTATAGFPFGKLNRRAGSPTPPAVLLPDVFIFPLLSSSVDPLSSSLTFLQSPESGRFRVLGFLSSSFPVALCLPFFVSQTSVYLSLRLSHPFRVYSFQLLRGQALTSYYSVFSFQVMFQMASKEKFQPAFKQRHQNLMTLKNLWIISALPYSSLSFLLLPFSLCYLVFTSKS